MLYRLRASALCLTLLACGTSSVASPEAGAPVDANDASTVDAPISDAGGVRSWIDTHAHPVGIHSECSTQACVDAVVATMDKYGARRAIFIHPPSPANNPHSGGESLIHTSVQLRPDRFFLGVGGSDLNSRIQATAGLENVTTDARNAFATNVSQLLAGSGAVVIGETAALHLSYEAAHPFEQISPTSTLFKDLADLAAAADVPIDFHVDAVKQTMPLPTFYVGKSPNNPAQIEGNMDAFSALLAYNRKARFVWAHVGRDTTGDMSAPLVDAMLAANENLFIQIHAVFLPLQSSQAIVDGDSNVHAEWLELLKKYPDRAVIGSDSFFNGTEDNDAKSLTQMQQFLQRLPADLAQRIGCDNPVRIYRLSGGC